MKGIFCYVLHFRAFWLGRGVDIPHLACLKDMLPGTHCYCYNQRWRLYNAEVCTFIINYALGYVHICILLSLVFFFTPCGFRSVPFFLCWCLCGLLLFSGTTLSLPWIFKLWIQVVMYGYLVFVFSSYALVLLCISLFLLDLIKTGPFQHLFSRPRPREGQNINKKRCVQCQCYCMISSI